MPVPSPYRGPANPAGQRNGCSLPCKASTLRYGQTRPTWKGWTTQYVRVDYCTSAARPGPRCQCAIDIISLTGPSLSMPHPPSPGPPKIPPYRTGVAFLMVLTAALSLATTTYHSFLLLLHLPPPPLLNPTPFLTLLYASTSDNDTQRAPGGTGYLCHLLLHHTSHRIA